MKVKISETVEVTDEQRAAIGDLLGKKQQASRDECREFIWKHGRDWAVLVSRAPQFEEDLIGDPDAELADLI